MESSRSAEPPAFERFAGLCAVLTAVVGFLYALSFVVLRDNLLSGLFLMLSGLLASPALVAVYQRLRKTDESFALWALVLGLVGAFGSAVHGGYDLANSINPPGSGAAAISGLPSQVDPRGLLTFGVVGIAFFALSWLIGRGGYLPRGLSYLGYLLAILLIVLYLGRLIVLDPTSPVILVPVLLTGFIVNPAWYLWLGLALWRIRWG